MKHPNQEQLDKQCRLIIGFAEVSGYNVEKSTNERQLIYIVNLPISKITIFRHHHNGDYNFALKDSFKIKKIFAYLHDKLESNPSKLDSIEEFISIYLHN